MRLIENIGTEAQQRHVILFEESEITLTLKFYPTIELWSLDVEYKDFAVYGLVLSLDVLHMRSRNQAFDFVVRDTSGTGIDPFRLSDFADGRCQLYLLEPSDMSSIRRAEVPL